MTRKFLFEIVVATFVSASSYAASTLPLTFAYTGKLTDSTDAPILDNNIHLRLQIYNPAQTCLLYEEDQYIDTTLTNGHFNLTIGSPTASAKRTAGSDPGLPMSQVFQNSSMVRTAGANCASAYTPLANDGRYLQTIIVSTSVSPVSEVLTAQLIQAVPYATTADTLQGKEASDFISANPASNLTQVNLENVLTGYTELMSLIAGTSTKYMTRAANQGANIPSYAATPSSVQPGQIWYDSSSSTMKYYNGTSAQALGSGLTATGTPGTYTKVTTDTFGRVTAGTSLVEADVPTLSTAGKVSGTAITSGTIGGSTAVSTSGNIDTSGNMSANGITASGTISAASLAATSISSTSVSATNVGATNFAARNVQINDSGTYKVTLLTPVTLPASYTLTLPADDGTPNQVLQTDGSGVLSWATPAATGIASLTVTSPLSSTGGSNPTLSIPAATSSSNGYLASGDFNIFAGKLDTALADGKIFIGNGSNVATGRTPSGDVTMGNTGAFTVNKLNGTSVSGTAPAADQFLKYDSVGSAWKPGQVNLSDLKSTVAGNLFVSPTCASNQTLSWNSLTDNFSCINIDILDAGKITTGTIGAARMPAFSGDVTSAAGSTNLTLNTVPVSKGGTGSTTALSGNRLMISNGSTIVEAPALTNGQIFIGSTGAAPAAATIVAGSGVSVTPGSGTLTISSTGSGGTVTGVSASAGPISVTNSPTNPVVSISQANSTTDGFLTSTDFNNFNGKLSGVTAAANLGTGLFWIGDGTGKAQPVSMTGDGSLTSAGVFSVGSNIPRKNTANIYSVGGHEIQNNNSAIVPLLIKGAIGQGANLTEWRDSSGTLKAAIPFDANPLAPTDLTTKTYVDTKVSTDISAIPLGNYVLKAGGTMTGALVNNTNSASTAFAVTQGGAGYAATFNGGKVGIGTATPSTALEVAGTVRIGDGAETCGATFTGGIRYNGGNIQFCNGTSWTTLGVAGSGITALTGDVTATGTGSVAATISNDVVTFAKMQNIGTAKIVGRTTAAAGDPEEIGVSSNLTLSALTLDVGSNVPLKNAANTFSVGGQQINNSVAATKPLIVKSAASQTASLTDWQNSAGTTLYGLDATGVPVATTDLTTKSYVDGLITAVSATSGVTSFKARAGAVTPAANDYTWAQIDKTTSSIADLTTRSAADLSSGILPDARLSTNVPQKSTANAFTDANTFTVPTTSKTAVMLKSSDDNNTKNIFETQNASGTVKTSIRPDGVPTATTDLTTKTYVDTKISTDIAAIPLSNYVLKAGDTMIGALVNNTNSASTALSVTQGGAGYAATFTGGKVGIGTATPSTALEVAGTVRVGDGAETCGASFTGGIRYNSSNLQFCNGTSWTTLGVAGAGITALTGDVTAAGTGSAASTVAFVGGSSASAVNTATVAVSAATNSNTASTIVKRDGLGNFTAGTVTTTAIATGAVTQTSSIYKDSGSNTVTVSAPTTVSTSYTLKYPAAVAGATGQVLASDTSGNMSWTNLPSSLPPIGAAGGDLSGNYPSPTVANGAVTLAKMANMNTAKIIGRTTAAAGTPEEIGVSSNLALSAGTLDVGSNVPLKNTANTFSVGGHLITNNAVGTTPLVIRAVASQTAPLQQWQNSASAVLYGLDPSGGPVAASDLANRGYVLGITGNYLLKSGGTLTGQLDVPANGLKVTAGALTGSPTIGIIAIDSGTGNTLKYYDGSAWQSVGTGSGTVNSGTINQLAFYSVTGSAVSGTTRATISNGALSLGTAGSAIGTLAVSGNTSGTVTIQPQAAAGTYNFNLPITAGTSGYVLASGGGAAAPMTWTQLAASATTDTTSATNISGGTLNDLRLSSNVPQKNTANAFTDVNSVTVPTTTKTAVIVKSSDDNNTKNILEIQNAAGTVKASIRPDAVPTAPTDLTTKSYVDNKVSTDISAIPLSNYVLNAGSTMTGALTVPAAGLILPSGALPAGSATGTLAFDSSSNTLKWYNGASWLNTSVAGTGTVTNVAPAGTAGNPITVASGSTAAQIDIPKATGSANGYLSSTDWNSFNSKLSAVTASNLPAFTGDVTSIAGTAVLTIANDAVTFAKMQNIGTAKIIGRTTAAVGDPEEIGVSSNLSLSGLTLDVGSNVPLKNAANTFSVGGQLITNNAVGTTPLVIRAVASQTAPLQQWQDSASAVLYGLDPSGGPVAASDLANRGYVLGIAGNYLLKSGGTMTGQIDGTSAVFTSSSANAFAVGAAGATNPAFVVDSSTATSATGISVKSAAAGSGVSVSAISSSPNENLNLSSKGTGSVILNTSGAARATLSDSSTIFTPTASSSTAARFSFTGATDLTLTSGIEAQSVVFNLGQTRTHSGLSSIGMQRDFRIVPSTHAMSLASFITDAHGLYVQGAPIAGANTTIGNTTAIYVPGFPVTSGGGTVTNAYGLNVNAPTGANNNYAATFGGKVGINTSAPSTMLQVNGTLRIGNGGEPCPVAGAGSMRYNGTGIDFCNGTSWFALGGGTGDFRADGTVPMTNAILATVGTAAAPSITFNSNTGNGMFMPAANSIGFSTAGSERVHIDSLGNVGIGTLSPGYPLEVNGGAKVGTLTANSGQFSANNSLYSATSSTAAYPGNGNDVSVSNTNSITGGMAIFRATAKNASAITQTGYWGAISNGAGYSPSMVFGLQTGATGYNEQMRIDNGSVTMTGALSAASMSSTGAISGGTITSTGNITSGNDITAPGNIGASGYITSSGYIRAAGQISSGSQLIVLPTGPLTVNWNNGNTATTNNNCGGAITLDNLRDGGSYTLVVTDVGTTTCGFNTAVTGLDAGTVAYRYKPANGPRTANSHTIYSLIRVGTTVYVSWTTGF